MSSLNAFNRPMLDYAVMCDTRSVNMEGAKEAEKLKFKWSGGANTESLM